MASIPPPSAPARTYPKFYLASFVLPVFALFGRTGNGYILHVPLSRWIVIVMALASLIIFGHQIRRLYATVLYRKLAQLELWLVFGSGLAVALAAKFGDLQGIARFGNTNGQSLALLPMLIIVGVAVALFIGIFAFTNTLYFMSDGKNRALNILGKIGYTILWIVVAGACYVAYNFMYASHDPSSE